MTAILDYIADASASSFRPSNPIEFFALQLARFLGDSGNLQRYLRLCERQPLDFVFRALKRAAASSPKLTMRQRFLNAVETTQPTNGGDA
jgi:hypothetical protein